VAEILEKLPAKDVETAVDACKAIIAGGPEMVGKVLVLVGSEFGDPKGVKPKYALHGVVIYASRPGAPSDRRMVAETLGGHLASEYSTDLKAFICRQLQLCGRPQEIPALSRLLTDPVLCEPATQAMLAIGTGDAAVALRKALGKVEGKQRATVIQALGRLKDKAAAPAIRKAAGDADRDVRLSVLYALGNAGDGRGVDILFKAVAARKGFERTQAIDACLRLGRQLAGQGTARDGGKVLRRLLAECKAPADVHNRCAALAALAEVLGASAVKDVMAAMDSGELRYRVPAARTAVKLAASLLPANKAEARKLLEKVAQATKEQAVLQEARRLLAKVST
jgi:HEAT repeat protein